MAGTADRLHIAMFNMQTRKLSVVALVGVASAFMAGCVVQPVAPGPVYVEPSPPPGIVYMQPYGVVPGPVWGWDYRAYYGGGWYHPHHGRRHGHR